MKGVDQCPRCASREVPRDATVRKIRTVQIEGSRRVARDIEHYNLNSIVGPKLKRFASDAETREAVSPWVDPINHLETECVA